jgi:hypothetical protein
MPKLYAAAEGISVCEKSDKFLSCVAIIYSDLRFSISDLLLKKIDFGFI